MPNLQRGTAQCSFDLGETYGSVKPSYDGGSRSLFDDCVIEGVGDEFDLTYTSSSLLITLNSGSQALIGGSYYVLKASASITLPANSSNIYLCLNINKGNQDGNKADLVVKTQAQIVYGNLNGADTERDMPIYKITTNASGVSSIEDLRKIVGEGRIFGGLSFARKTRAEYNALPSSEKVAGHIFFVREN